MKIKIFDLQQFAAANKIERLYMYIMQPDDFVLTNAESIYLNKLKIAFAIFSEFDTKVEMYAKFDQIHLEWKSERTKIFKDCQELFGRLEKHNPEMLRIKLTEQLLYALSIAKLKQDYLAVSNIALAIGKLNMLDKPITESGEKFQTPQKVTFFVNDRKSDRTISDASSVSSVESID